MSRNAQTVAVAGGTLYQVAAQYLGDATQWNRIAALNGLFDPWLPSQVLTLKLPPVAAKGGNGGILGY
jgi:nucleoid-associated protein YgaU